MKVRWEGHRGTCVPYLPSRERGLCLALFLLGVGLGLLVGLPAPSEPLPAENNQQWMIRYVASAQILTQFTSPHPSLTSRLAHQSQECGPHQTCE